MLSLPNGSPILPLPPVGDRKIGGPEYGMAEYQRAMEGIHLGSHAMLDHHDEEPAGRPMGIGASMDPAILPAIMRREQDVSRGLCVRRYVVISA